MSRFRCQPQLRPQRGFTLIELLVVVTIVMVLIALLLPALAKAKNTARVLACRSNLRQIGLAWSAYLVDSEGQFPFWRQNMQWFYGGEHPSMFSPEYELQYRPLNPYVQLGLTESRGSDVFRCTDDRDIRAGDGSLGPTFGYPTHEFYGNSYMMNFLLLYRIERRGHVPIFWPIGVQDVQLNYDIVPLAGDCQWYYSVNDAHWDAHFHNRDDQVNLVFLDGHADFIQLDRGRSVTDTYSFLIRPLPPSEEQDVENN